MCVATESLLFCYTFQNAFDACNYMPCGWRDLSSHETSHIQKVNIVRFSNWWKFELNCWSSLLFHLQHQTIAIWRSGLKAFSAAIRDVNFSTHSFVIDFFRALFSLWFWDFVLFWLYGFQLSQSHRPWYHK